MDALRHTSDRCPPRCGRFLPSFLPAGKSSTRLLPFGARGPRVRQCGLISVQRRGGIRDAPRRQEAGNENTVETTVPRDSGLGFHSSFGFRHWLFIPTAVPSSLPVLLTLIALLLPTFPVAAQPAAGPKWSTLEKALGKEDYAEARKQADAIVQRGAPDDRAKAAAVYARILLGGSIALL